jgi:hypothetical protein
LWAESENEDFPLNTEVCWLSCHKVVKSFYDLTDEIITFLEEKEQGLAEIRNLDQV